MLGQLDVVKAFIDASPGVQRIHGPHGITLLAHARAGGEKAKPVLLEPVMRVEVVVPEEFMGDVIGDLNSRRGQIEGMESRGSTQVVRAFVPLAQMFGYVTDLRSMTQGRATSSMEFSHYAEVPANLASELVQKSKV